MNNMFPHQLEHTFGGQGGYYFVCAMYKPAATSTYINDNLKKKNVLRLPKILSDYIEGVIISTFNFGEKKSGHIPLVTRFWGLLNIIIFHQYLMRIIFRCPQLFSGRASQLPQQPLNDSFLLTRPCLIESRGHICIFTEASGKLSKQESRKV